MPRKERIDDSFVEYVCDQLDALDAVTYRSMFGGYGLYCGSLFFAIVFSGRLYFKTDDMTRLQFVDWGSEAFQPSSKQTLKTYFEVPAELVDEAERLAELAEEAVGVAASARD